MTDFLVRFVGNVAAIWVASKLFDKFSYGGEAGVLLIAALVFTIVNWIVKPVLAILSIPLIIVTFGIAYFFVNVLMLVLTDALVDDFEAGPFWTVVGATIVVWLVNLVVGAFVRDVRASRRAR
jgi:putative membrane protein